MGQTESGGVVNPPSLAVFRSSAVLQKRNSPTRFGSKPSSQLSNLVSQGS